MVHRDSPGAPSSGGPSPTTSGGPGAEAILAPFEGLAETLSVVILDRLGTRVAGNTERDPPNESIARDIAAGPLAGGRVVAWGPAIGTPLASASIESLAVSLAIAHTVRGGGIADLAAARRIEEELAHGRRLQRSFVSLVAPEVPGYDVASYYEAAREVGGDFFDLFRTRRRGRPLSIVIADVTGKGIAAALLMAFSRPLLRAAIDNTTRPAEALERTNRVLVQERRSSLFITAICGRLELGPGRLSLANAGHEPPLLLPRNGGPLTPIGGSGVLLGAFDALNLTESVTELQPGDVVVFYTDGVTDAASATGERFGDDRLAAAIQAARGNPAPVVVESIQVAVDQFQAGLVAADDITIVAIGRHERRSRRRRPATASN